MNKYTNDVRQHTEAKARAGFYSSEPVPFEVSYTPIKQGVFNIYLFGVIEDAKQFTGAIEVLQAANESDLVQIHLSTDGGSLDATDTLLQAMRECEGRIVVKASGGVHSAGTVILLEADEFTLSENFCALVHNGGCGAGGKFSDFKSQSVHAVEYMERIMRKTYKGFLTPGEITALLEGKDYWFFAEEFAERFEARNLVFQAEYAAAQIAEAEEALAELKKPTVKPKRIRK